ncbi:MAG TPA: hypothetical protein VD699_03915 [Nitrosopumilaceae archaeon]|nr:hypothetical protein [Nitrosopumilaceae archaeon]HXV38697.1 hypothetical protein [Nitrosopumilaceae archaeon]
MVEEYSAAYWMGSLLADELLFDGRGRKWIQRKVSSTIKLTVNRFVTGLRSPDWAVPLLIPNGIWQ